MVWALSCLLFAPFQSTAQSDVEKLFWESVNCSNTGEVQAYIEVYPDGTYVEKANQCLEALNRNENDNEDRMKELLQACSNYVTNDRLTGIGKKNAFDCYTDALEIEPNNLEAITGIQNIERIYTNRALDAVSNENIQEAVNNFDTLRAINPSHPSLISIQAAIDNFNRAEQEWSRVDCADLAQVKAYIEDYPDGKYTGNAKRCLQQAQDAESNNAKNRVAGLLEACTAYMTNDRLTGVGRENAFDCYNEVVRIDPDNLDAKSGIQQIEHTYASRAISAIAKKDTRLATKHYYTLEAISPNHPSLNDILTAIDNLSQANEDQGTAKQLEKQKWAAVSCDNQAQLDSYLESYPKGLYASQAYVCLDDIKRQQQQGEQEYSVVLSKIETCDIVFKKKRNKTKDTNALDCYQNILKGNLAASNRKLATTYITDKYKDMFDLAVRRKNFFLGAKYLNQLWALNPKDKDLKPMRERFITKSYAAGGAEGNSPYENVYLYPE